MKKVLLALIIVVSLTGCTKINDLSIDNVIDNGLSAKRELNNQYRTGYKYYLPRGLSVVNQSDYNEKLNTDRYSYYLYVDLVSYYNKVKVDYVINKNAYYSKAIKNKKSFGYLEIKPINDKYLVEIMYNYAKIEVIVKKQDINNTVANAITILNSIQYNNNIVENVMGENILQFKETELNIFETKKTESNYINYEEMYGQYEEKNDVHDSDLIE